DEMPGVQALEHCVPDHWGPGRPRDCPRREWEYSRHGTQTVIAAFDVRTGKVVATCSPTRPTRRWSRFNRRHGGRFVFHYTPKHASSYSSASCTVSACDTAVSTPWPSCAPRSSVSSTIGNSHRAHSFRWSFTGYPLQAEEQLARSA